MLPITRIAKLTVKNAVNFFSEHSNVILTGLSVAGTVASVIFAVTDTPKCMRVLEELEAEGASNRKKAGAVVKTMSRTGIAAGVSITASILNGKINGEKIDSLLMKYQMATTAKELYKDKTREIAGDEVADKINQAVATSHKPEYDSNGDYIHKIVNTGHGEDLMYLDWGAGCWLRCSADYFKNQGIEYKDRIINGDECLFVNEVLSDFKLPTPKSNAKMGWHPDRFGQYRRDNFFEFSSALDEFDRPYTVVTFACDPVPIGKPNSTRYSRY